MITRTPQAFLEAFAQLAPQNEVAARAHAALLVTDSHAAADAVFMER